MSGGNSQPVSLWRKAKKTIRRSLERALYSISRQDLIDSFNRAGLKRGDTVCVHSSLKSLGYVAGGPNEVIEALISVVGSEGCIMMPSFPLTGTMAGFLEAGTIYDVRNTPALTGALTEVFRRRPDVKRSLHPTNPLAAWGASAEEMLVDHEKSITPYGMRTPYGRLADHDRGYILMMGTHIHSLLHHLQERVGFPNLFLEQQAEATYIDYEGILHRMKTKVMRPRIPYFVAVPSVDAVHPDWALLHDFALVFPESRDALIKGLGYRFNGYQKIVSRRGQLIQAGILKSTRLGRGQVGLLKTKEFIQLIEPELNGLIAQFRSFYKIDDIAALGLPYD